MPPKVHDLSSKEIFRILTVYEDHPDFVKKHCPSCRRLLEYGTWGYHEGWHFDGCYNDED